MKKIYFQPTIEVIESPTARLLSGSSYLIDDAESIIINGGDEADAADACSREFDDFIDSFFKVILLCIMMTFGLGVYAQKTTTVQPADAPADGKTHSMTLYFSDDTEVKYELNQLEHVTYLPGVGMKVYLKTTPNTSIDYLFSQMTKIVYAQDGNTNSNWEKYGWSDFPEAWRLEYPQLSDNTVALANAAKSQVVVKKTNDFGITYSVEWDNAKIANRWTCYQLHEGNTMATVDRHDDFKKDPEVAVSAELADYSGSGFSRGHLCPSADRLCSTDQNKQTFFLTNMQPQYQSHNGGLWSRLETLVRDYATDESKTGVHCDTLYVVKAATITDKVTIGGAQVDGVYAEKCNDRLLVPTFFYMALLHYNKETDTYHAIAFWTKHIDENQSVKNLGDYAISIDELEQRTGIDFFCNLPDAIEEDVESEEPDLNFWHITKTK